MERKADKIRVKHNSENLWYFRRLPREDKIVTLVLGDLLLHIEQATLHEQTRLRGANGSVVIRLGGSQKRTLSQNLAKKLSGLKSLHVCLDLYNPLAACFQQNDFEGIKDSFKPFLTLKQYPLQYARVVVSELASAPWVRSLLFKNLELMGFAGTHKTLMSEPEDTTVQSEQQSEILSNDLEGDEAQVGDDMEMTTSNDLKEDQAQIGNDMEMTTLSELEADENQDIMG
ncbi:MAG: hypothetical protein Q9166_006467 [cf. Caloplaca sp. 2 TL-2023]